MNSTFPEAPAALAEASCELTRLRSENQELRAMVESLAKLEELVYRDALTGLRNRRYFEERMAEELAHSRRHRSVGSLLLLDVDDFKRVNDLHGHVAGDEVLRQVARLVEESVRVDDAVCRIGGDEFAVVLCDCDEEATAQVVARLREHLRTDPRAPTLSIGAAAWSAQTPDLTCLLGQADAAMYADKASHDKRVAQAA